MNKTLVIIPTYNERENLPDMVARLSESPVLVDLLIVDGNSSDGTGQLADELAAENFTPKGYTRIPAQPKRA
jgi:dolichol-phosphate mannosyltransferase